eukprot:5971128-Prymnesium_polylepis.1
MAQSLMVQIFVPQERVLKFDEWSYLHVSGLSASPPRCDYGALAIGSRDRHRTWQLIAPMLQGQRGFGD